MDTSMTTDPGQAQEYPKYRYRDDAIAYSQAQAQGEPQEPRWKRGPLDPWGYWVFAEDSAVGKNGPIGFHVGGAYPPNVELSDFVLSILNALEADLAAATERAEAAARGWDAVNNLYRSAVADITALKAELEEVLLKDLGKTNEINILVKENRELGAELEAANAWRRELTTTTDELDGVLRVLHGGLSRGREGWHFPMERGCSECAWLAANPPAVRTERPGPSEPRR